MNSKDGLSAPFITIEIDLQVFQKIKKHADELSFPFSKITPNDVLRQLFGLDEEKPGKPRKRKPKK